MTRHLKMVTDKKSSGCLSCWLEWEKPGSKAAELLKQGKKTSWRKCVCSQCIFSHLTWKCPFTPSVLSSAGVQESQRCKTCTQDKTNTSPDPAWEAGKVLVGCPAGTAAKCSVPFRWHSLVCFEYYSSKFLNSGNPPNPSLELLVGVWGLAIPREDPQL